MSSHCGGDQYNLDYVYVVLEWTEVVYASQAHLADFIGDKIELEKEEHSACDYLELTIRWIIIMLNKGVAVNNE